MLQAQSGHVKIALQTPDIRPKIRQRALKPRKP
jgi:hypothetical protein